MKDEVDTVTGFLDIPPYVTIVPPCLHSIKILEFKKEYHLFENQLFMSYLKNLRTREAELPPTQLNPSEGSGISPYHVMAKRKLPPIHINEM